MDHTMGGEEGGQANRGPRIIYVRPGTHPRVPQEDAWHATAVEVRLSRRFALTDHYHRSEGAQVAQVFISAARASN